MLNYCTYDNFLHFGIFLTFVLLFVQKLEWTEIVYGPFVNGQLMVGQRTLKASHCLPIPGIQIILFLERYNKIQSQFSWIL